MNGLIIIHCTLLGNEIQGVSLGLSLYIYNYIYIARYVVYIPGAGAPVNVHIPQRIIRVITS